MSMHDDWDVEQHKVEYESDEHWELRRKFLLAHKHKFPEDILVCLAQVFVNVELLGCRYPQETMDLVKELSQDVAAEYREKQKKKLQRTFVEASEAASSKVKGCSAKTSTVTEESIPSTPNPISNTANNTDESRKKNKKRSKKNKKLDTEIKLLPDIKKESISNTMNYNYQSCENLDIKEGPSKQIKTEKNVSVKNQNHPYEDIVLWEKPDTNDNVLNILEMSAGVSGIAMRWKYSKIEEGWECSIIFDSEKLSCSTDINKKVARQKAAIIALEKLQKHCYTVKVKGDIRSKITVTTEELKSQESQSEDDWKVSNCIGKNMMKMMGWTGGGLGKSEQGIVEPMSAMVKTQINREGLGLKKNSYTEQEIKIKCRKLFKDLLQTDTYSRKDIVFLDFPKEDRIVIHQVARAMGLKSRSQGKDQRKLIVSSKVNIWSLVRELNNLGGVTEKYELVKPTDEKFISLSTSTCT
ncbi:NF-kappa-B-repressing factor [Trachymyrmex septentrionalis]|uniref:NF-kappa-B-repressing factor n=1 Tax=Trachymyrmex septentrionalis TaxID=34720 RepID=A0A195ET28_9HYME|nr:PREDICTED: NF-kappa-B-repressing factor isoform X1 [Trachymyrmex septentrionalis]XP_018355049.1 PREDICTED: NF-kappa-B-repressing factor isoform X1 [Trachymyrmex septentrionalis]XP_018355050.1 PREDICTED: NF-kappa-B-repressing factor isoform X1 [Trachymyrmex septentrionalis]KYN31067.1 NF-kappa-B-repressing factor [Trachymyrmex septentrionalis]